ncbi:hypothetical protein EUX98_g318 [Antrodiella citrinella]|uniref:Blue (type 1) copper domain-containing protein n=1 Tax=Antrodiella citrinella TaxID=2447956 RepID=A0A4S4N695_9APHY|nr:hypothetical protein EUX98_g318 [Antrodiella citrinella]
MFKLSAVILLLLPFVLASPQFRYVGRAGPTGFASLTETIEVGPGGNLGYSSTEVSSSNGGIIVFEFDSDTPHSVTQSSFEDPCTPLSGGFDSGLQSGGKTFSITITDSTKPVYYFCKSSTHCGQGMVGVINPTDGQGFDQFQAAALKIGSSETPLTDNGFVSGGVGATATAVPSAGAACTTTTAGSSTSVQCSGGDGSSGSDSSSGGSTAGSQSQSQGSGQGQTQSQSAPTPTSPGGATQSQSQSSSSGSSSQSQSNDAGRMIVGGGLGLAGAALIFGMFA